MHDHSAKVVRAGERRIGRYGLETDPTSIARLVAEHGLVFE